MLETLAAQWAAIFGAEAVHPRNVLARAISEDHDLLALLQNSIPELQVNPPNRSFLAGGCLDWRIFQSRSQALPTVLCAAVINGH